MRVVAFTLATLCLSTGASANETDPWYAWVHPPRDGTSALNHTIGERLAQSLRDVNRGRDPGKLDCRDVAARMTTPMRTAAFFFFASDVGTWGADYSPRTASEYFDSLSENGSYRHLYGLLPLDPSMRSGDVLFGTDKLGHFFTNGLRQYDLYRAERARGASKEAAVRATIDEGIREEKTWLGLYPSGILSYADLEANHQGFMFFRSLCEDGELALVDDVWTLTKPFDIARWVSPCWDEAYSPSYFLRAPDRAKRGLAEMCEELDDDGVRARLEAYRANACTSASGEVVRDLVARGELPDPSPWSYEAVCTSTRAPSGSARNDTLGPRDRGTTPQRPSLHVIDGARTPGH